MPHDPSLDVSFVLATHNRCAVATNTLTRIHECASRDCAYEVIVADNASTDGTAQAVRPLCDRLLPLRRNFGSCAKAYGVAHARGRFIVFLDDDSHPQPGSITRMIERFDADERLGAAGFTVHLPDGRKEGSALPDVFLGCGVGLRADALRAVGGLDASFFMQAEEYDLSFRLEAAGWRVRMFCDLHVDHLKTDHARRSERTTYYDIRNNLRVSARYLPQPWYSAYRADWIQRYSWLARRDDHETAHRRGRRAGNAFAIFDRLRYARGRLEEPALQHFFRWAEIQSRMAALAADGVKRVVFADLGKNVFAYHRGARLSGLEILAIGDDRFAAPGRTYRDVPIVGLDEALDRDADAVIVANTSAVHGTVTYKRLVAREARPVHHWFLEPENGEEIRIGAAKTGSCSDRREAATTCSA